MGMGIVYGYKLCICALKITAIPQNKFKTIKNKID